MRFPLFRRPRKVRAALLLSLLLCVLLLHAAAPEKAKPAWSFFSPGAERAGHSLDFISDVYAGISPSVVGIAALLEQGEVGGEVHISSGSGLVIDGGGQIVTNYHVVAGSQEITVSLSDQRTAPARLIHSAPAGDLALLKIDLPDLTPAELGSSSDLRVGEVVFPIGNPGGEQFARSMTMGLISGVDRQMLLSDGNLYSLLQTDAAINPGNSGGPLVDCEGRVVGINSVKIVDADFEGMGFAIPIDTVKEFIAAAGAHKEE